MGLRREGKGRGERCANCRGLGCISWLLILVLVEFFRGTNDPSAVFVPIPLNQSLACFQLNIIFVKKVVVKRKSEFRLVKGSHANVVASI